MYRKPARLVQALVTAMALAACTGTAVVPTGTAVATPAAPSVGPSAPILTVAPPSAPASPVQATPTDFTSAIYGYRLTVPAGWSIGPAILRWDGTSAVGHEDPYVDKFAGPGSESFFAFAKPYTGTLDAWVKDEIAAQVRDHSDTCLHPVPKVNEPITLAGGPGIFLASDCGILINQVLAVRNGIAFTMVARDTAIPAMTDPADRALFDQLLASLTLPS